MVSHFPETLGSVGNSELREALPGENSRPRTLHTRVVVLIVARAGPDGPDFEELFHVSWARHAPIKQLVESLTGQAEMSIYLKTAGRNVSFRQKSYDWVC